MRELNGGAISLTASGTLTMQNSTIAGNASTDDGGGLSLVDFGNVTLNSVTIADNTASGSGPMGTLTLTNTIVANNSVSTPSFGYDIYASSAPTLSGPNLIRIVDGSDLSADGTLRGTFASPINAGLGTLGFYGGGLTRVIPLLTGSPALDVGATTLTVDQRGADFTRPQGGADDIGAFEAQPLRNIIITPDMLSKIYGTMADPTLTYTNTGAALYSGDSLAAILNGSLVRDTGSNVGSYEIFIGSLALNPSAAFYYTLSFTSGVDFTINPRVITVTADALSKVYGTAADPSLTFSVTGPSGGLVAGDSITLTRAPGETVAGGPYAITIDNFVGASNYSMTYVGANFTINPRVITVTADTLNKVYGDADPSLTFNVTGPGLASGDSITLTRVPGETVPGGPYAVTIDSFIGRLKL